MKCKKAKGFLGIILALGMIAGIQCKTYAEWAQVTAVLPATEKTVSSEYALFKPTEMYGSVSNVSAYPIKFQAMGANSINGQKYQVCYMNINVGQESTIPVNSNYNYQSITLTGWNINSAVKGCIGYGYIED